MRKNEKVLKAREAFIKARVEKYEGRYSDIIQELADTLFLSVQTVENDFKRSTNEED